MRDFKTIAVAAAVAVLAAGCSVYRDYSSSAESVMEELYPEEEAYGLAECDTSTIADIGWADFFRDSCLLSLIDEALVNNADLNVTRQKVIEAQASLRAARMAFLPSLTASPSGNYYPGDQRYGESAYSYTVPLNASWEIGFGGLHNRRKKAQAALEKSELYACSVQTELVASVAECYYTLLKLDAQLDISRTTSESWAENVRIMKAMKEAGMTNEASVAQTEANACSIEASLFDLDFQVKECERRLCVLVGIAPCHIERLTIAESDVFPSLDCGIPVQLLSHRYDVRSAEADMKMAYYDEGIALAAFYPALRISPSAAWEKAISSPAGWLISLGGGLTQPLLSRGSLSSNLTASRARLQESSIAFRQAVLKAGAEVSDALALCESAMGKTDARLRQIAALESAVVSTKALMRHSQSTYLEVLTAQQSLLSAQLLQISDRYDLLRGTVSLYRALGGGSEK